MAEYACGKTTVKLGAPAGSRTGIIGFLLLPHNLYDDGHDRGKQFETEACGGNPSSIKGPLGVDRPRSRVAARPAAKCVKRERAVTTAALFL